MSQLEVHDAQPINKNDKFSEMVKAANSAQTEEVVGRVTSHVRQFAADIKNTLEEERKIRTIRRVATGVGAVFTLGIGYWLRGLVERGRQPEHVGPNSVDE